MRGYTPKTKRKSLTEAHTKKVLECNLKQKLQLEIFPMPIMMRVHVHNHFQSLALA